VTIPEGITVEDGFEKYLEHMASIVLSPDTVGWERNALKPLVAAFGTLPVSDLSYRHMDSFLGARSHCAMATRRSNWLAMVRACSWLAKRGMTGRNVAAAYQKRREDRLDPLPWKTQKGKALMKRGKPQLRSVSEANRYLDAALALPTPEGRVAAALPLLTGLASGEIRHLRAGDVDLDDGPGRIWIRGDEAAGMLNPDWDVKTASRQDTLEIPPELRSDLGELVHGLEPTEYIFKGTVQYFQAGGKRPKTDAAHCKGWLQDIVHTVCLVAGVRNVPPHGLRGVHGTLRHVLLKESAAQIGEALRHADKGVTAKGHYIGAPEDRPVLKLVKGGKG